MSLGGLKIGALALTAILVGGASPNDFSPILRTFNTNPVWREKIGSWSLSYLRETKDEKICIFETKWRDRESDARWLAIAFANAGALGASEPGIMLMVDQINKYKPFEVKERSKISIEIGGLIYDAQVINNGPSSADSTYLLNAIFLSEEDPRRGMTIPEIHGFYTNLRDSASLSLTLGRLDIKAKLPAGSPDGGEISSLEDCIAKNVIATGTNPRNSTGSSNLQQVQPGNGNRGADFEQAPSK